MEPHCLNDQEHHNAFRAMVGVITRKIHSGIERLTLHLSFLDFYQIMMKLYCYYYDY